MDLGTKGSGTTPWSRAGDGRLTLKGAVREILATEMLEALGLTTSRTLSVIETGEDLDRSDEPSPTRSAVLVRLNHSHVRYGSFQRQAYLQDAEAMQRLVDYALRHLAPDAEGPVAGGGAARSCRHHRQPPGGAVHGGGVRPWRAQHRQHQHHRRKLRLWPVALRAELGPRFHRRLFRPLRPLFLRPPGRGAAVERLSARRRAAPDCAAGGAEAGARGLSAALPGGAGHRRAEAAGGRPAAPTTPRWSRPSRRRWWRRR